SERPRETVKTGHSVEGYVRSSAFTTRGSATTRLRASSSADDDARSRVVAEPRVVNAELLT
ncbi:MAG: hypothetical protein WCP98_17115, partial [Actinomycetes bacterium]